VEIAKTPIKLYVLYKTDTQIYRIIETFESLEDAQYVLDALEKVNISHHKYKIEEIEEYKTMDKLKISTEHWSIDQININIDEILNSKNPEEKLFNQCTKKITKRLPKEYEKLFFQICKNPEYAWNYVRHIMNIECKELKPVICKNPTLAM
jgi:hypothetical protein